MRYCLFFCLIVLLPLRLLAAEVTPHEQVDRVTKELIALIVEARDYFDKDPERYYQGVEKLLDPMIDFPSFTRSVMGNYGTREYYQSLPDAAARDQYRASYERFVSTFKTGLVHTYAKGMLAFNGQAIEVLPPSEADRQLIKANEPVDVVQRISGGAESYDITYKMRPNSKGEWLLRNVIIESVNVGQLYRNQFAAAMEKHQQDFAAVIDNWVIESAESAKEEQQYSQGDS